MKIRLGSILPLLGFVLVGLAGCRTAPMRATAAPRTVKRFPSVSPAMVRLPIHIVIPKGKDYLRHMAELTQIVKDTLQHPALGAFQGLNTNVHVVNLWKALQEPIFLDDRFWLLVKPSTLSLGLRKPDLKNPIVTQVVMEMTAQPEIVFGPKPETHPTALPKLDLFQSGPGIFHAMSNARFSFQEMNEYFRVGPGKGVLGRLVADKADGNMTLRSMRFYGEGGKVCIVAKLLYDPPVTFSDKRSEMTVTLRGTPRYRVGRKTFDFPDLDLDIESGNLLVKIAGLLFKGKVRDGLRRQAVIPIGPKLDWLRGRVDLALNRPIGRFARLRTTVTSLEVHDAFADDEGLEIRCSIQGASTLDLVWN